MKRRLRRNGFESLPLREPRRSKATFSGPVFNFSIPFLGDSIDQKLRRLFKSQGINIRIVHKTRTLFDFLRPDLRTSSRKCTIKECTLKGESLCFRKQVVYLLVCSLCNASYIGSTERFLHQRVREHLTRSSSPVFQHSKACGPFYCKVLQQARDPVELRIMEGLAIRNDKPGLNLKDEVITWERFII